MAEAARHLHVIDASSGEVLPDGCPSCQHHKDTIATLNRKRNGMAAEITALRRERAQDALDHPLYGKVEKAYDMWRRECGHPRSTFTTDDFWLALPFFEKHEELVPRAIAGAKFDCFKTRRKNGSWKRHDDWTLIFRDRAKFEEFCNRAPTSAGVPVEARKAVVDRAASAPLSAAEQGKVQGSSVGAASCDRPAPGTTAQQEASR